MQKRLHESPESTRTGYWTRNLDDDPQWPLSCGIARWCGSLKLWDSPIFPARRTRQRSHQGVGGNPWENRAGKRAPFTLCMDWYKSWACSKVCMHGIGAKKHSKSLEYLTMTLTLPRSWMSPELPMWQADPISLAKHLKPKLAAKPPVAKDEAEFSIWT